MQIKTQWGENVEKVSPIPRYILHLHDNTVGSCVEGRTQVIW